MTFEVDVFDGERIAFDVAQLAQPVDELDVIRRYALGTHRMHHTDPEWFRSCLTEHALLRCDDTHCGA